MGNCTTKPKVLKDSDEAPPPPVDESTKGFPATETVDAAAETRRTDKGKGILIADDDEQHAAKRPSLSNLFEEDKPRDLIQIENTEPEPVKQEIGNQTGLLSSDAPKPDQAEVSEPKFQQQEEIMKNQSTDPSSHEVPKPEASSLLEVSSEAKAPHPMKPEVSENQTGSLIEIPKLEDSVPIASEVVMVPPQLQTSTEDSKMEPFVPETSELTFSATNPQEQVFEDAQEKIEPEVVLFDATTAASREQDNKESTVYAEEDTAIIAATEKETEDPTSTLEKKIGETGNKLSELGTEEENRIVVADKPEVTK